MTDGKGLIFLKYCMNMLMKKNKQVLQFKKMGKELEVNNHKE